MSTKRERLEKLVNQKKKATIIDDEESQSDSYSNELNDQDFVEDDEGNDEYVKEDNEDQDELYAKEDAKFKTKTSRKKTIKAEIDEPKPINKMKQRILKAKENDEILGFSRVNESTEKLDLDNFLNDLNEAKIGEKRVIKNDEDDELIHESKPKKLRFADELIKEESKNDSFQQDITESSFIKNENSNISINDVSNDSIINTSDIKIFETDDGYQQFYFMDYLEENNKLYLFGKMKISQGIFKSCMIQVNNLCKELYFLPNDGLTVQELAETSYEKLLSYYGVSFLRTKNIRKKYAFELQDVPRGKTSYFRVSVPFDCKKNGNNGRALDLAALTDNKAKIVFGNYTRPFEAFVLQKQIMGPSWIKIKNLKSNDNSLTHCALSFQIDNVEEDVVNDINNLETPTFRGVTLRTQQLLTLNQKQELVSITIDINRDFQLLSSASDNKVNSKTKQTITLVRVLGETASVFNPAFRKKMNTRFRNEFKFFNDEKSMLTTFLAIMRHNDPDFILGHRIEQIELDIIVNRMLSLNINTFSQIGRFQRANFNNYFSGNTKYKNSIITAGRMIVDIGNELGISLTPKCDTWDLLEMKGLYSDNKNFTLPNPTEVNMQTLQHSVSGSLWEEALVSSRREIDIINNLVSNLQIIPLSLQLTNLAGNGWRQTLQGSRAIRNEFILLHEFTKLKYIVPDPYSKSIELMMNGASNNKKKLTYQGGLVFEPEKGLHKDYTLVMDFNSLYPSIIQEFNICFTTVSREDFLTPITFAKKTVKEEGIDEENKMEVEEEEVLPEYPSKQEHQLGVLPKLLKTLVDRRRSVKQLMASSQDPFKKSQYDIKQQALKLTANSMYGCLGFKQSRFYARPLAMMITNKGREILQQTRNLAEQQANLQVVYGDTDSVMINSRSKNYMETLKIGENFKNLVNRQYASLEIDIDNVFQRLLLTAKKKYAALNVIKGDQDNVVTKLEVKGLDMKRREYCPLTKKVSEDVLSILLSEIDEEESLNKIYDYLEGVSENLIENKISLDQYRINTRLGKDPENYGSDGKNKPVVQAALKMKNDGRQVRQGTVITFVIVDSLLDNPEKENVDKSTTSSIASRALPLREVMRKKDQYKIDSNYYLEKQLFNPIKRLLENIEGFEVQRFADSLKIKSNKFNGSSTNSSQFFNHNSADDYSLRLLQPLESLMTDSERFATCDSLLLNCGNCGNLFEYHGIVKSKDYRVTTQGLKCLECQHNIPLISIMAQLEVRTRAQITKYYETPYVCDDTTCDCVTYGLGVYGKKCLKRDCYGGMLIKRDFNDKMLYTQLSYFQSLFDYEKNKKQLLKVYEMTLEKGEKNPYVLDKSESRQLSDAMKNSLLEKGYETMEKYLEIDARRYVDLGSIFG